jgi:hypothetical protein
MKIGEIITGFFAGLIVWLVVFILVLVVAGAALNLSWAAVAYITALLLIIPVILLFRNIGKSDLATGMVISLAIGILLSALCGFSNPGGMRG